MEQNKNVINYEEELKFDMDKVFFIIDSNNLSDTKENLYGYVFKMTSSYLIQKN